MKWGKTKSEHRAYFRWWRNKNRKAYNAGRLAWVHRKPKQRRIIALRSTLKVRYGMSLSQFYKLCRKFSYRCGICRTRISPKTDNVGRVIKRLNVDHCHLTNKVRGVLCWNCNAGLGQFKDKPKLLKRAAKYLEDVQSVSKVC